VYSYATSGLPTNCYGRRYINNRIRQLAAQEGFMANLTDAAGMNLTANTSSISDGSPASRQRASSEQQEAIGPQLQTVQTDVTNDGELLPEAFTHNTANATTTRAVVNETMTQQATLPATPQQSPGPNLTALQAMAQNLGP
jgi:hypothetical protein